MSMVLIEKSFALYNGKNRILKIFLYVIAVLSGAYLCSILPYADQTLYMYPYFVIGFLYCRFREKISTLYKCIFSIISLIAFIVMLCFFQREHYIYTTGMFLPTPSKGVSQLATDLFRYSIGLFGSIAVSSVLYLLSRVLWKKIINVFAAIGKKSLQLYLVQRLLVEYICGDLYVDLVGKLGYNPLIQNLYLYNIIITPLIACAFIVIMYAVIILLYKFKRFSTFIFGR